MHEIDSGTSGATSLEVRYLVLDLDKQDAVNAAETEAERLKEAGGGSAPASRQPASHSSLSTEANASTVVYTLAEYLDDIRMDEWIAAEVREAVLDAAGLILVVVEPRT